MMIAKVSSFNIKGKRKLSKDKKIDFASVKFNIFGYKWRSLIFVS